MDFNMSYLMLIPLNLEIRYLPCKRSFFWWEEHVDKIIIVSPSANNVSHEIYKII